MAFGKLELIPVSYEKENEINNYFAETMFGSVNTFVGMFNSGVLNRGFSDTRDMAERVKAAFANVSLSRSSIVVQTPEEFRADKLAALFDSWRSITRLRREISEELKKPGTVFTGETVLFIDKRGVIYRVDEDRMYKTPLGRISKDAAVIVLKNSTAYVPSDEDNEYRDSEGGDFELSLDDNESDGTGDIDDVEFETEEDTAGTELPEEAKKRTVKISDVQGFDDSFINDVSELVGI